MVTQYPLHRVPLIKGVMSGPYRTYHQSQRVVDVYMMCIDT